jgi:hypothetical protein
MAEIEYRVDYTITRRGFGDLDFEEIGFGSSGAWHDLTRAVAEVEAQVQNYVWETSVNMPDPQKIKTEIEAADQH